MLDITELRRIAEVEFADIVADTATGLHRLRVILKDTSFIDVWFSLKLHKRYSFHWDRKMIDGLIYRHDNAPHKRWENLKTFPKHFHDGDEDRVTELFEGRPCRRSPRSAGVCASQAPKGRSGPI